MTDQLLQDLHALLGEVDVGWHSLPQGVSFGIGGCLMQEIHRVVESTGETHERKSEIIKAMGFVRPSRLTADRSAMFAWNDAQTDPDAIKRRIKDAIEGLGS